MPYKDPKKEFEYQKEFKIKWRASHKYRFCECCEKYYPEQQFARHTRSELHIKNLANYDKPLSTIAIYSATK